MIQYIRECLRRTKRFLRRFTFRYRVDIRIRALLVRAPNVLMTFIFRRRNTIGASNIIRTTFPNNDFRYSINDAMFTRTVTIIITLLMPPFVVKRRLQVRLNGRNNIAHVNGCFVSDPTCRKEFTIANVILKKIDMSAISGRTIQLLMIRRNSSIILNRFKIRFNNSNARTPTVPYPGSSRVTCNVTQSSAFIGRSATIYPPVKSRHNSNFRNSAIVFKLRILTRCLDRMAFPAFNVNLRNKNKVIRRTQRILRINDRLFFKDRRESNCISEMTQETSRNYVIVINLNRLCVKNGNRNRNFTAKVANSSKILFCTSNSIFTPLTAKRRRIFDHINFSTRRNNQNAYRIRPLHSTPINKVYQRVRLTKMVTDKVQGGGLLYVFNGTCSNN